MRFSWLKMSSRRVNTVEPSCGTKAIGAFLPHPGEIGIRIGPERGHVDRRNAAHWTCDQLRVRPGIRAIRTWSGRRSADSLCAGTSIPSAE